MIFPYACIFKKINLNADILVMPKEPEDVIISKLRQDMNGDNDNLYSDKKAGNDPTEIFAIREYAPGDKIRNIHWKISAKMGQTMVKDYGLPLFEKDTVIIENSVIKMYPLPMRYMIFYIHLYMP